jgi:hypothetical protein
MWEVCIRLETISVQSAAIEVGSCLFWDCRAPDGLRQNLVVDDLSRALEPTFRFHIEVQDILIAKYCPQPIGSS